MALTTTAFEAELLVTQTAVGDPINLVWNPSAEVNVAGWSGAPSSARSAVARVAASATALGAWMVRATSIQDGQMGAVYTTDLVITPGQVYTVLANVLAMSAGRSARIGVDWKDSANVFLSGGGVTTFTTTLGQRVLVTGVAPAGAARASIVVLSDAGALTGDVMDVDGALVVAGSYSGQNFDGSTPGYGWTGTPHASTSRPTQVNYVFNGTQRGLMAGAALKLRRAYLSGFSDPAAHALAKNHPKQVKALTDNAKLASFDAITGP
jgi:hypothetical protein